SGFATDQRGLARTRDVASIPNAASGDGTDIGAVEFQWAWNAAGAYSAANNPNGVWRYGWSQTLGSPFILDTARGSRSGLGLWLGVQWPDGNPVVAHNASATEITTFCSVTYQPGQLGFHPGPNGENAVVRFTAPATGSYNMDAAFVGLDFVGPTTADVHIL